MYKLCVLPVNNTAFSIASPAGFTYLAVSAEAVYLPVCQLLNQPPAQTVLNQRPAEQQAVIANLRWGLEESQPEVAYF
ncbi:hypothetical protein F1728_14115 [Gimesia benthica]|uniref:Uncharacterized protein n=1 Tax=Gimesia benthica TaxID=2608982 RepID=A0A6I6ADV5_9PLAN|nr:hypothetical protein [Gimesia benthica]QGQ23750.1 hypothetical protein F1728_14115 [Gimesia benthica]